MVKKFIFLILIVFITIIYICSCAGKTERSRKPVCSVEIVSPAKIYSFGQPLQINVRTKLKNGTLKKVDVYYNGNLIQTSREYQFSCTIPSLNLLGINSIRVIPEKSDGVSNTRNIELTVLSDITPEKYNYKLVREYQHSSDHFTQGLQILNGVLYEGTGENGKSALFKININNNKILNIKTLPEKYFGEGITILNEKIYQLTYKHKVGFVYRLSDFAVIDSFSFSSPEGWGLTNDGNNLIMSDGTGTLTWINPENFAVIKKLQVADQEKVIQYLNELEYDRGFIWANIWTTNQIIKIDAETGKVVGVLDLTDILGIMTRNKTEKIDVLNGIALFSQNNHLLITGKLWPKMFEIEVFSSK
jgi:glutaminyl-peptide cyclotransferase